MRERSVREVNLMILSPRGGRRGAGGGREGEGTGKVEETNRGKRRGRMGSREVEGTGVEEEKGNRLKK